MGWEEHVPALPSVPNSGLVRLYWHSINAWVQQLEMVKQALAWPST